MIILVHSVPRSGTNFLCDTLQKTLPRTAYLGELIFFTPRYFRDLPNPLVPLLPPAQEDSFFLDNKVTTSESLRGISEFIDHYPAENLVIKIQQWAWNLYTDTQKQWLADLAKTSVNFHLIRESLVDSVISQYVANKTRAFTISDERKRLQENPHCYSSLQYNYGELKYKHTELIKSWKHLRARIPENCSTVTYDQITNLDSLTWKQIQQQLSLPSISTGSWSQKQDKSLFQSWKLKYIEQLNNQLPLFYSQIPF